MFVRLRYLPLNKENLWLEFFFNFLRYSTRSIIRYFLSKVEHFGIRGNALARFQSYPTEREQFVIYNGVYSTSDINICGLAQGSILASSLFVYINGL